MVAELKTLARLSILLMAFAISDSYYYFCLLMDYNLYKRPTRPKFSYPARRDRRISIFKRKKLQLGS